MAKLFTNTHEWAEVDGKNVKVGISNYAASELGDIVFVSLPSVGDKVSYGESFMEVESVKSVAEINAPVNGKIIAVNEELDAAPELINQDAEGTWIAEIELDGDVPADLMTKEDYETESMLLVL